MVRRSRQSRHPQDAENVVVNRLTGIRGRTSSVAPQAPKDSVLCRAGRGSLPSSQALNGVKTSSGREFSVVVSSDPDIFVQESGAALEANRLALEIKGGEDGSNIHNRAGEAEKSHLKTKKVLGYQECWTVIASANHSLEQLKSESPSTDKWFDVLQVINQSGESWEEFKRDLRMILDLELNTDR